jgi:hypothetical protein
MYQQASQDAVDTFYWPSRHPKQTLLLVLGGEPLLGEQAVCELNATRGGALTRAYRYVGPGEARLIEKTGRVPNTTFRGDSKNISLSPQEFWSASQAEEALGIGRLDPRGPGRTPTHGVEVDLQSVPLSYGGTGGTGPAGIEVQTRVSPRIIRIFELEP